MKGTLEALVSAARNAGPADRIEWRDRIAGYGDAAIREMEAWLTDDRLAAFAVRVIDRASVTGDARYAEDVLRRARVRVRPVVRQDIDLVLGRLRTARAPERPSRRPSRPSRGARLSRS